MSQQTDIQEFTKSCDYIYVGLTELLAEYQKILRNISWLAEVASGMKRISYLADDIEQRLVRMEAVFHRLKEEKVV